MTATEAQPPQPSESEPQSPGAGPKPARMLKFTYQAENPNSELVKGSIRAVSAANARNQLAAQGLRVSKLTQRKGLQTEITRKKVPAADIMHFSRQMATFLRAGVPMTEAIASLSVDTTNKRFQEILGDVVERISAGARVADALAAHADVFPSYYMAMLSAAELTGRMDMAFDQLHAYIKRDIDLRRAVRSALVYPLILLGISVLVVGVIVVFAIPRFAEFFEEFDATLPLPTRILMAIANFVTSPAGLVTGIILVALVVGTLAWVRTASGKRAFHGFLLKLPITSKVVTYSSTERFCRILAALMEAGVPLPQALPTAVDGSNNMVFKERLGIAMDSVLQGAGFAGPLGDTELFPPTVVQMIRVGERSGELSTQLQNAAGFYEEELGYSIEKMTAWFEPMTIIFIGLVVGFVALAMMSAMYGIYNQVDF